MSSLDGLILAVPLFFAAPFAVTRLYEIWIESRLRASGITTEGEIADLRSDSRAGLSYTFVEYSYHVGGEVYTSRQAVSAAHFARLKASDQIAVSYLPSNPAMSRMAGGDQDNANRRSMIIRALLLLPLRVVPMIAVRR